jgi:GrpB-like predicted nucleotidyltransferase (UPF0157 family)
MAKNFSRINKNKYKFLPYNKQYPFMFLKEKNKIKKSLDKNIIIEHVGSTAVPGLGGKGIIDIAIKTPKNRLKEFMNKLERLGYIHTIEHKPNNKRIFFQKIIKYKGKESRIHIHLTLNNEFWETFIAFRDYLRNHDKELDKYAKIKKEAVKHSKGEGRKYRKYKTKYLENITKKALNLNKK